MKNLLIIISIFSIGFLGSCSSGKTEEPINKYGYNMALQEILDKSKLTAQSFDIDNSRDTTIFGRKGTIISIPKDCFQTSLGKVQIELIESLELSDILLLNAQTKSNGNLIQTDGIVYLNAFVNEEEVTISQGKSIQVEIPSSERNKEMLAFVGEYDEAGTMNWEEGNEMLWSTSDEIEIITQHEFFTIPLQLFPNRQRYEKMDSIGKKYPITKEGIYAPSWKYLMGKPRREFYKNIISFFNNKKSIESPLATREFANRLREIDWYYHVWYYEPNEFSKSYKFAKNPYEIVEKELFDIYIENMDKPLVYSDSLTVVKLKSFKETIKDESSDERLDKLISDFEEEIKKNLTYPIKINTYGIDLDRPNAYQLLLEKGIPKDSARLSIELYNTQQEIIESLRMNYQTEKRYLAQVAKTEQNQIEADKVKYYLLEVNQLGWINVDQYYYSPNSKEVELLANFNAPENLDFLNVSLVLPNQNSYLTGFKNEKGQYQFTKEQEYYTKLPVGELAYIIGISYQDGKPVLGMKEIIIGENENEEITASSLDFADFKSKIDMVNGTGQNNI